MELSGRGSAALRGAFQSAAGRFLTRFHLERKERLISKLDAETWRPSEVANCVQVFVSALANEGRLSDFSENGSTGTEGFLLVDKEKYIVVG